MCEYGTPGKERDHSPRAPSVRRLSWRDVVIEPEEVVRVVLPFHRLQASQVRTKRIPDGLVALFIQAGEIEVLAITREWFERTKNLPSPVDACRVILWALPVGLDSDEIRRGTITKGSVLRWYTAECATELPDIQGGVVRRTGFVEPDERVHRLNRQLVEISGFPVVAHLMGRVVGVEEALYLKIGSDSA